MGFALTGGGRMRSLDVAVIALLISVSFLALLRISLAPNNPAAGIAVIYAP